MPSPRVPALAEHLQAEWVEALGVFLLSEEDVVWLGGALHRDLLARIDGQRTVDALVEDLAGQHSAPEVHYALERLFARGYLVEADPGPAPALAAWWRSLGVSASTAEARLTARRVSLRQVEGAPACPALDEALDAAGVRRTDAGGELVLVVVDDYLRPPLADLNREALASGQPWMLARLTGRTAWLGPHFIPGRTACWVCLERRLGPNRLALQFVAERRARGFLAHPVRAASESAVRAAAGWLATAVARGLVTGESGLVDTLVTLDPVALRTEHHAVVRRPQCPACGQPGLMAERQSQPVRLDFRSKAFIQDGGHRLTSPEETLRRHQHQVSPLTGVVQHLKPLSAGAEGMAPIIDAGPNLARRGGDLDFLRHTLRGRSNGKGMTLPQARASGLGEAIERYSGVFQGDEARREDTLAKLGTEAIHPQVLLGYSARQYQNREAWNATHSRAHQVFAPFDADRRVEWSPVWSLTHGARRWVPTAYCYFGYPSPAPVFCQADSNGCAAGNSLEEAVLQGFLELAERDAVALWWYNRVRRPRVELESFDEPYLRRLEAHYRRLGRELWVLDLTHDLGVPTFAAVSHDSGRTAGRISLGFGAHLDARIGLLRAVTEMNQFLPLLELPTPGEPRGENEIADWLATASLAEHSYLLPTQGAPLRAAHFEQNWSEDLREDVERCVSLAGRLGLETLVLDQTRPDIGLSVVRVIVPGLRHMWPRFGPGRLYDVPVQLGWLPRPLTEEQLNPVGVFF